jgi:hypothetical protein
MAGELTPILWFDLLKDQVRRDFEKHIGNEEYSERNANLLSLYVKVLEYFHSKRIGDIDSMLKVSCTIATSLRLV